MESGFDEKCSCPSHPFALACCLLSLPTTRVIRWLDALQQVAITVFCARPTWTLSDPTHAPSHAKATSPDPITGQK
jgi:hypothetical protein